MQIAVWNAPVNVNFAVEPATAVQLVVLSNSFDVPAFAQPEE